MALFLPMMRSGLVKIVALMRHPLIKILALAVVLGAYFFVPDVHNNVNQLVFLLSMVDVYAVRGYVESTGNWAPLVSIGLMVFQAVLAPLPAFVVTFANAALFGWVFGAVLSWTGAMLGAMLCYWLAWWFGRDLVERVAPPSTLRQFDALTERWGMWAVFVARLLPFVPFDPVSYAAGLARLGFVRFVIATGIGQLPATIVYSMAGDLLAVDKRLLVGAIALVFVLSLLPWFFKRSVKRRGWKAAATDVSSTDPLQLKEKQP
jgi:uncharacterized membrane protein YdjX (TVP38/TMEM64 family)